LLSGRSRHPNGSYVGGQILTSMERSVVIELRTGPANKCRILSRVAGTGIEDNLAGLACSCPAEDRAASLNRLAPERLSVLLARELADCLPELKGAKPNMPASVASCDRCMRGYTVAGLSRGLFQVCGTKVRRSPRTTSRVSGKKSLQLPIVPSSWIVFPRSASLLIIQVREMVEQVVVRVHGPAKSLPHLLRDLNRTGKSSNMAGNRKEAK